MAISYEVIAVVVVIAVIILFLLIWRNQKDKKKFERDTIQSEFKPEKHDKDESV